MEKTDLQKQFEEEQDREAVAEFSHGKIYLPAYGEWCERKVLNLMDKAEAYDRVCQGKGVNLMKGKFIAVDMEEQTIFILSGDSEYLKQQEDTLLSRGGTLLHEQEPINDTISMMAFELTKAKVLL